MSFFLMRLGTFLRVLTKKGLIFAYPISLPYIQCLPSLYGNFYILGFKSVNSLKKRT